MSYILVVDDDPETADSVVRVMRSEGHEAVSESDLESALASICLRPPDLLFLDVMFPGNMTGGFDLARSVRAQGPQCASIPIIMMSSINQIYPFNFSSADIDDEWMPVTEFVEKPIDFDVVKNRAAQILALPKDRS